MSEKWEDGYYFCNNCGSIIDPETIEFESDGADDGYPICPECFDTDVDYFPDTPDQDEPE